MMLALSVLPLAQPVRDELLRRHLGGRAARSGRRSASPITRRSPATRCSAPASCNTIVFAVGAVAGQMVLGFVAGAACAAGSTRGRVLLPHDLHPADPHPRHRHRRDLEADAQLRFRPRQPGARPRRPRAARLARRAATRRCSPSSSSTSGTGRRSASCCSSPAWNPCRRTSTRRRKIDGAIGWQELVHVTLPMMVPTILVTFAFRLVLAFKVFDEVYLLTGGGPGTATEVVSFTLYQRFFTEDRVGYGAAMSVAVIFLVSLLLVIALSARRGAGGAGMSERAPRRRAAARRCISRSLGAAPIVLVPVAVGRRGRLPHADIAADRRVLLHAGPRRTSTRCCSRKTSDFLRQLPQFADRRRRQHALCLAVATLAAWSLHRMRWPRWVVHVFLGWALVFHMIPPIALAGAWFTMLRAGRARQHASPASSSRMRRSTCRWRSG